MGRALVVIIVALIACAGCRHEPRNEDPAWRFAEQHKLAEPPKMIEGEQALAEFKRRQTPHAVIWATAGRGYTVSADHEYVTFGYDFTFCNDSSVQIRAIDVALVVRSSSTRREIFRTPSETVSTFHNRRVPYVGPLEPFCDSTRLASFEFTIPNRIWTADAELVPTVTKCEPVADDRDLHDFGNLNKFMIWSTADQAEAAFRKDPSLFKVRNAEGANVAMIAAAQSAPEVVDFMLANGVDAHARTTGGHDLLYCALMSDRADMVAHVAKMGFQVNRTYMPYGDTPLDAAIVAGCEQSVHWLVTHGADPNKVNRFGQTPIYLAVEGMYPTANKIIADLAAGHANIHRRLPDGKTLMHYAVWDTSHLEQLMQLGLSVNERASGTGETPLMEAAEDGRNDVAKWLIKHGADARAVDAKGENVLDYARRSNTLHTDYFFLRTMGWARLPNSS